MHKQECIDKITAVKTELCKAHKEGRPTQGWKNKLNDLHQLGKEHQEVREIFRDARNETGAGFSGDCAVPGNPHEH